MLAHDVFFPGFCTTDRNPAVIRTDCINSNFTKIQSGEAGRSTGPESGRPTGARQPRIFRILQYGSRNIGKGKKFRRLSRLKNARTDRAVQRNCRSAQFGEIVSIGGCLRCTFFGMVFRMKQRMQHPVKSEKKRSEQQPEILFFLLVKQIFSCYPIPAGLPCSHYRLIFLICKTILRAE